MVAYIMSFFTWLLGNSEFAVRFGGLLCTAISLLFIYMTTRCLFPTSSDLAWDVVFIANNILLFSAACIVLTPDTPLMLFWSIALYCGARIVQRPGPLWWYLWGVALGLGLLSKYTMILIVPCQFGFMLFDKNQRKWLLRKEPYMAILLGLLIFSPVILWNYQHDWISFAFQLSHGLGNRKQNALGKLLRYIGGEAGVVTPLIFCAFLFYSIKASILSYRRQRSQYLYLLMLSWPIILFFAYSSIKGKVAGLNWPATAYIAGLILLYAVYYEHYRSQRKHRIYYVASVCSVIVINVMLLIHLIHPMLPIPPEQDTTKQFHGWQKLGAQINTYISNNPHGQGYFLLSDRNQRVAEAVYYSGRQYIGLNINEPFIFLPDIERLQGKNAIILDYHYSMDSVKRYGQYFDNIILLDKYQYLFRNREMSDLSVHFLLGQNYHGNLYRKR